MDPTTSVPEFDCFWTRYARTKLDEMAVGIVGMEKDCCWDKMQVMQLNSEQQCTTIFHTA